jgi:pimeloyl-ACP methyl ester carboxylesterase
MYIEVKGEKTYIGTGSGRHQPDRDSVLFVHGAGFDHTIWTLPARYFARQGLNVVAVDLPAHGRSRGDALTTIEDMADWLVDVLVVLGIEQAAVVGHSMGSLVALTFAATHPQKVRSLALLGTSTPMPVSDLLLNSAKENDHSAIDMANTWSHSSFGQQGGNENPGISMFMSDQRLLERAPPGVFYADLAACNAFKGGDEMASRLDVETLVILGLDDKMTRPGSSRSVAESINNARILELNSCGHSMLSEKPNTVLDALISVVM